MGIRPSQPLYLYTGTRANTDDIPTRDSTVQEGGPRPRVSLNRNTAVMKTKCVS